MSNHLVNIGEGISIFGIMLVVGVTENYWLLIVLLLPICTWITIDKKIGDKCNDIYYRKSELEINKLQEELRLLKLRKK